MAIALTLQKYLAAKGIRYDLVKHNLTDSSMETAKACHVPRERVAKGVFVMRFAMRSLYCQRHTTSGSQRLEARLGMMFASLASMRRPNCLRIAREVLFQR